MNVRVDAAQRRAQGVEIVGRRGAVHGGELRPGQIAAFEGQRPGEFGQRGGGGGFGRVDAEGHECPLVIAGQAVDRSGLPGADQVDGDDGEVLPDGRRQAGRHRRDRTATVLTRPATDDHHGRGVLGDPVRPGPRDLDRGIAERIRRAAVDHHGCAVDVEGQSGGPVDPVDVRAGFPADRVGELARATRSDRHRGRRRAGDLGLTRAIGGQRRPLRRADGAAGQQHHRHGHGQQPDRRRSAHRVAARRYRVNR